jgi:predicted MFS family arabinose efflux permease
MAARLQTLLAGSLTRPFPDNVHMLRLIAGWLTLFAVGTDLFVISPLVPLLAGNYQVGIRAAGLSVTSFSLAYVIAAPLFGRLADRFGRRNVLTWCLLAFAASNLLTAEAGSLPAMLIARSLCGIAAAGVTPSVYALVGNAAPAGRRGTWISIVLTGLLLSLPVGAPLGTLASLSIGWPVVFRVLAASGLMLALLNYIVWQRTQPATVPALPAATTPHNASAAALVRTLLPTVAWSTALYGMYTYMSAGLTALDYDTGQITALAIIYGGAAFAGTLIGGRVADRLGPEMSTRVSLLALAICFTLFDIALSARAELAVALALGATSLVAQTFFPAQQSLLMARFPARTSTALAWNNSALFLGMTLGSLIGGQAMALDGLPAILPISALLAIAGWAATRSAGTTRGSAAAHARPPHAPDRSTPQPLHGPTPVTPS